MQPTDSGTQTTPIVAVDAATIMILRETSGSDFEVFMLRRHQKSGFMANMYVYPGGKRYPVDSQQGSMDHVVGMTTQQIKGRFRDDVSATRALGLFLAGIRETFEEAGILLACKRGSREYVDLVSEGDICTRFADYRHRLISEELALSELLAREELVVPLDKVGYFAHWITPYIEHRRFDTRFFLALAPPHQEPLHDAIETTASLWIQPSHAIDQYQQGQFALAPPTLRTLEQLSAFDSAKSALQFAQSFEPPAILPHFTHHDGELVLLLPGDPEFPEEDLAYHHSATAVTDGITRMVLRDGKWHSIS